MMCKVMVGVGDRVRVGLMLGSRLVLWLIFGIGLEYRVIGLA
jgi:hypothetical protein